MVFVCSYYFFFSSRIRHTRLQGDWSSDVCSSDLETKVLAKEITSGLRIPAIAVLGNHDFESGLEKDVVNRSEERRVGKEGRGRRTAEAEERRRKGRERQRRRGAGE